jgi:hypothetical protein
MKRKKETEKREELMPNWVPDNFKGHVDNILFKIYENGLTEVMAVEMRIQIVFLGEAIVMAIKKGDLLPGENIKAILENLIKYWPDPISHEKEIFKIQKDLSNDFNIT